MSDMHFSFMHDRGLGLIIMSKANDLIITMSRSDDDVCQRSRRAVLLKPLLIKTTKKQFKD